jgi:PadR family transcriptional regulator AphA
MSVKYALLGLLLDRPAYPYQLGDQLPKRLGPAWKINSGQIHQAIKILERDGLIERTGTQPAKHHDRHIFEITNQGIHEFDRFFGQTPNPVRLTRRPLLAKITFAGPDRLPDALTMLDTYEQECAKQLTDATLLRETLLDTQPSQTNQQTPLLRADQVLLRLNITADIFQLEGELRWSRHAHETLSWLCQQQAHWPSGRGHSKDTETSKQIPSAPARASPMPSPATQST